ncbi:ABC transporter substrate-binding protein [Haloarchaeobius sp. TZWSO28]|uniref:ABC transporter substrate-binding protein n=1 Tax=Haloarchaeobius sp. TZWSO28 TaxID=3446119 RepID=UPI003EB8F89D
MLALSAVGISAGVAGCNSNGGGDGSGGDDGGSGGGGGGNGGSGGGDDGSGDTSDEQMFEDRYWIHRLGTPPADVNFQFYRTNADWYLSSLVNTWGADGTTRAPQTTVPILFKNWGLKSDGVTFSVELNDDFYWHDGKNVTAQDIRDINEMHFWMQSGQASGWMGLVEGGRDVPGGLETALPEVTGEYTLEYTFTAKLNSAIIEGEMFNEPYRIAPQQYSQYLEEFRNASGEDEIQEVRVKLADEVDFETDIGFGPMEIVDRNDRFITLEFFDDYPWETVQKQLVESLGEDVVDIDVRGWGKPNFAGLQLKFLGGDTAMQQEVRANQIDGGFGPYISEDQLPDGRVVPLLPVGWGQGIMFNMWTWGDHPGEKHLNPRLFDGANDIRKALAHCVDRELAAQQLGGGPPTPHDEIFTGLLSGVEETAYGDDFLGQLNGWEQDYDKAAEYFEKAGFTMNNGVWHTPDGEPWQPIIKDGAGVTRYVNMWEVASSNFSQAGVDIQVEYEENSTFFSKDDQNRGYDLTTGFYGAPGAHPWFGQDWTWRRPTVSKEGSSTEDWLIPGDPYEGEEEYVEVPPVGNWDTNQRQRIYPKELLDELQSVQNADREKEILETLAWACNWWIPKISIHEHQGAYHLNTAGWKMPNPHESVEMSFSTGFNMPFHFGIIRAE